METNRTAYTDIGRAVYDLRQVAELEYDRTHRRYQDTDSWWINTVSQVQSTVIERPGGRTTVHITITPRRNLPTEHYYWRLQRMPGEGYVEVAHTKG